MILQAIQSDIPEILRMYRAGLEALGETGIVESMLVDKVVSSYHLAPCFLLVVDDTIAGMAGLSILTSPWNGDATLSDYMFYIHPEYRSLENFSGLVEKSKEFASQSGLPLRLEFASDVSESVRNRLFKKHGFELCSVVGMFKGDI